MWYQEEGVVGMTGWARDVLLSGDMRSTTLVCACKLVYVCVSTCLLAFMLACVCGCWCGCGCGCIHVFLVSTFDVPLMRIYS